MNTSLQVINMSSLEDTVKEQLFNEGYEGGVNALNNEEFLEYISEALERILTDRLDDLRDDLSENIDRRIETLEERIRYNEAD